MAQNVSNSYSEWLRNGTFPNFTKLLIIEAPGVNFSIEDEAKYTAHFSFSSIFTEQFQ